MGYEQAAESEGFGKHYAESAQGMLTGMLNSQLVGSATQVYLYSVMYYDSNGKVIQSKSSNHLSGGVEKEYMAYDFVGHPLKRKHVHSATGKPTQTEVYEYTYDQAGRLLTTTHQLNGASRVILASNRYDAVGRLVSNARNGVAALKTEYAYNVRLWMKGITGPLFSQSLYYNDKRSNNTNVARYNGNISGMNWIADSKNRGYDFTYDALSRLKGANYLEGGARSDKFDTSYSYDRQGNVLTLSRRGNAGTTAYNTVDNLTMNYMGNQLIRVEDTGTNPSLSMSMDFKNGTSQEIEYSYDRNGNMVKDLNKGISSIEYNVLNLPQKVTFTGANNPLNEYVYSAAGKKLAVIHKSSTDKRTDYVGNMIYENSSLKRILVDGGYIQNGIYHFFLQDHLGNNRIVAKADGTVVQTNHYYPYGMSFAESTLTSNQPYRYNGKEIDLENGLNLYDYEARQAEVATGRFTTIDPLPEKYYSVSPYVYCLNNPLKYIDLKGDFVRVYTETQSTGHTWVSVGEGEDLTVYSYGRYNGTYKGPEGSSNSLANGAGVLLRLAGDEAKAYNEEKSAAGMSIFVVTDVADEIIANAMDRKFNSSTRTPDKGKYKNNPSAHVIDEYSLVNNNCTTVVSDVLNSSGSSALKGMTFQQTSTFGTWTTVLVTNRFILPASMQDYLTRNSRLGGPVYKTK